MTLAVFVGLPMLGAGIALWFMGPAWFYNTETYFIRAISIGLMAGGPFLFFTGLRLDRLVPVESSALEQRELVPVESSALERREEEAPDEVKKPAVIALVFDKSGSMLGEKLTAAVKGAIEFVEAMHGQDTLLWMPFDNQVYSGIQGRKSEIGERLIRDIASTAAGGGTALYDAISQAYQALQERRKSLGDSVRYGIVVLSDGQDTTSKQMTLAQLQALLRPSEKDPTSIQVRTIGIGKDADDVVLRMIADSTHSEYSKVLDVSMLVDVYRDIARYWGRTASIRRKAGTQMAPPNCPRCGEGMYSWTNDYCPKCGEHLPGLPGAVRKRKEWAWYIGAALAVFVALPMLGAGIALLFMGPAWFNYTETHIIRAISIGLMAGAPIVLVTGLCLDRLVPVHSSASEQREKVEVIDDSPKTTVP
jgi:Mg-chelatase subunit ChlD